MYNYDLYTGEPSYDGSPPDSKNELSQQEIVNNANMMFYTNPGDRYQQMQQQMGYQQPYYGYGYGYQQQPQQPYYGQQNPFMNQPSGFSGYAGNPAYQYMQNNGMQYQQPYYRPPVPQDYVYYVQGYNPSGTNRMILPADAKEICDKLQIQMNNDLEDDYEQRLEQQREYYSSLGSNYYGMPYAQPYNPAIINRYRQKIEDMRKEAERTRLDLNKHLSRLCHNFRGDDVDEDTIDAIYDGYTVTVPGTQIEENMEYQRMCSAQEIDTTLPIRAYDAYVGSEYKKYVNENTDMNTFFTAIGEVIADEMLEEERHRRRDLSSISMPTSTYRELIRKKVNKRNEQNSGFVMPASNNGINIPMGEAFPTLNESARLLDDGTLDIHAPAWLGNKEYVIKNVNEDEYELNRHKFIDSIYGSQNPLNGGNGNGG